MSEISAEKLAQRALDLGLVEARQLNAVMSEVNSQDMTVEEATNLFLRRELLTNWQAERILDGKVTGYVYGNYKVLYLVGAGSFARVYRAEHLESKQVVAVKVLRQRYTDDITRTEHFLREASVVIPLRHHNVVPIHEVKSERGRYYMVMDFVEGQNLREFLKVHNKLTAEKSTKITSDICTGLAYAFKQGITHRDMKLSNVLLSTKGIAQLVDFGLAAHDGTTTDVAIAESINARSIDYAALERATNVKRDDKRSDIFFLGCMLYQMLTGKTALEETRDRVQRLSASRFHDIKPILEITANLPQRVVMIANRAMELDVDKRYQTPAEMLDDIQAALKVVDFEKHAQSVGSTSQRKLPVESQTAEPEKLEGQSHTVMIVESNTAVQNALRERLKLLDYRVLVISSPQRALDRFDFETDMAECIVFGTGELGAEALEAFNRFASNDMTCDIPAILLVDERQRDLAQKQANLADHRVIVSMPLKFREFRTTLRSLIAARAAASN